MPRLATVIEGSSGRHMAPSAESTKSAVKLARHAAGTKGPSVALPRSSSPSMTKRTLTGSLPSVRMKASATTIGISIGPLSSETPRA